MGKIDYLFCGEVFEILFDPEQCHQLGLRENGEVRFLFRKVLFAGGFVVLPWITSGYVDLFDFWESSVPKPRTLWVISPGLWATFPLIEGLSLFSELNLDLLLLRGGGIDANLWVQTGLMIGRGASRFQLFLEYVHSGDTEESVNGPTPVDLLGWGFRLLVNDRLAGLEP